MIFRDIINKSDTSVTGISAPVNSGILINGPIELSPFGKVIVLVEAELIIPLSYQAKRRYSSIGTATNSGINYTSDSKIVYMSHDYYFRQFVSGNEVQCDVLIVNRNLYPVILLWSYFSLKCKLVVINSPLLDSIEVGYDHDPAAVGQFSIESGDPKLIQACRFSLKIDSKETVIMIVASDLEVDLCRKTIIGKTSYIKSDVYHLNESSNITIINVKLREAYLGTADHVIDLGKRTDDLSTCTGGLIRQTQIIDQTTAVENAYMGSNIYSYHQPSDKLYDDRYESTYFRTRMTIGLSLIGLSSVKLLNSKHRRLLRRLNVVNSENLANFCTSLPLGIRTAVFLYRWIYDQGYPCYAGIVIACFIDSCTPYFTLPRSQKYIDYNFNLNIEERKHQRFRGNNDIDTILTLWIAYNKSPFPEVFCTQNSVSYTGLESIRVLINQCINVVSCDKQEIRIATDTDNAIKILDDIYADRRVIRIGVEDTYRTIKHQIYKLDSYNSMTKTKKILTVLRYANLNDDLNTRMITMAY